MRCVAPLLLLSVIGCRDYDALTTRTAPLACPRGALLCDDFEAGALALDRWPKTNGAPPTVVMQAPGTSDDHVYSGQGALHALPVADSYYASLIASASGVIPGSTPSPLYLRAYLFVAPTPSRLYFLSVQGRHLPQDLFEGYRLGTNSVGDLTLSASYLDSATTMTGKFDHSTRSFSDLQGRWICVEWHLDRPQVVHSDEETINMDVWIDEQPIAWASHAPSASLPRTVELLDHLELGPQSQFGIVEAWIDDVVVATERIHCN